MGDLPGDPSQVKLVPLGTAPEAGSPSLPCSWGTVCPSSCQGDIRESAGQFLGRTFLPDERRLGMRRAPGFSQDSCLSAPDAACRSCGAVLPKRLVTLHSLKVPAQRGLCRAGPQVSWNQPLADFLPFGENNSKPLGFDIHAF